MCQIGIFVPFLLFPCPITSVCPGSCLTLCDLMHSSLPGSSVLGDSPGKKTGVGYHALLQGIFPTQGTNPGLQHCRQILYYLSHQGSPRLLEWVAYPFSKGSSHLRNQTRVSWWILYQLSNHGSPYHQINVQFWKLNSWEYFPHTCQCCWKNLTCPPSCFLSLSSLVSSFWK